MANITNVGIWQPNSGKQTDAYNNLADELLVIGYGGGKTDLLLGLAYTQHTKSLIMRRIFPSLRGSIERSREIYTNPAYSYNESLHIWCGDLPAKRTIEFQTCKEEKDADKFRGRPHDFIGIDSVNEFTYKQYRAITAWNRSDDTSQRARVVATMQENDKNNWTHAYWVNWLGDPNDTRFGVPYGELRWFVNIKGYDISVDGSEPYELDGDTYKPFSRTVIDMTLSDNQYLATSYYRERLEQLPEPTRSQMLYGKEFRG